MSPEDRPMPDDVVIPFDDDLLDPELAALDAELERAGGRLHRSRERDGRERPDRAFAAGLRERLLREAVASAAAPGSGADPGSGAAPGSARAPLPSMPGIAADGTPRRVRGRTSSRTPSVLPAPRWTLLGVAAALVIGLAGLNGDRLFSAPAPARVTEAAGATLEREGSVAGLAAGDELRAGDTVRVAADGRASLALGNGVVRLDGGTAIRIDDLAGGVSLAQLAGRAWHRVAVPDGGRYTVTTGDLRWTALGTAFDLAREPAGADGGERVSVRAVEHAVALAAPDLALRVDEGREAEVVLGGGTPQVRLDPMDAAALRDPWLLANARADRAAGFGVGVLEIALAEPSPSRTPAPPTGPPATPAPVPADTAAPVGPAATPSSGPALSPASTPRPTTKPTPRPTRKPTPKPTAKPTEKPTPKPTPKPTERPTPRPTDAPVARLPIDGLACAGTGLFEWAAYEGSGFDHYTMLRSGAPFDTPSAYPPPEGIQPLDDSYTTDRQRTWYADGTLKDRTWWYRAVAFNGRDTVIGASPLVELSGSGPRNLGPFSATAVEGGIQAGWSPYDGPSGCFTYYKVSWSATNPNPSYIGDNDGARAVEGKATGEAFVEPGPGTWYVRVEAVMGGFGTKVIVGKSPVEQVTVP